MKKVFYGSTALVAAGALAAPAAAEEGISLSLGGFYTVAFAVNDIDYDSSLGGADDTNSTSIFADGEVQFKGETTLDNGITFGVRIELEAFQSGDQMDENYAYIEGSFGRLIIGGDNGAQYAMSIQPQYFGIFYHNTGWVSAFVNSASGLGTYSLGFGTIGGPSRSAGLNLTFALYQDLQSDTHGLIYFSPRFSGFQVGVSYHPCDIGFGDGQAASCAEQSGAGTITDIFSASVNFVETFGSVDVAASFGFSTGDSNFAGFDDPELYNAGLSVGFAGFTIAGAYAWEDSDFQTDGNAYGASLGYSTGPWTVGGAYFHSETEGPTTALGDQEQDGIHAGVTYSVGPGIAVSASGAWTEWEGEAGADVEQIIGGVTLWLGF